MLYMIGQKRGMLAKGSGGWRHGCLDTRKRQPLRIHPADIKHVKAYCSASKLPQHRLTLFSAPEAAGH